MTGTAATGPVDPALLGEALDAVPDGVAVFDGNWTFVYVNLAGAEILQRERDHLLGRTIWVALPELGGTILHSFLLHARSAGQWRHARRWRMYAHWSMLSGQRTSVSARPATCGSIQSATCR